MTTTTIKFKFPTDETLAEYAEDQAIEILINLADAYYIDAEPLVEDAIYDAFYKLSHDTWPTNPFFGKVGAVERGSELKHEMPIAGLKQLYTLGDLENWLSDKGSSVLVGSEKLDGGSGSITYRYGNLVLAATRGDGIFGKDITRHLLQFTNIPRKIDHFLVNDQESINIRGELIISKKNFPKVKELLKSLKGRDYKNARNTIVGLINAKDIPVEVFSYLDFVAYDIAGSDLDKVSQLLFLQEMGFKIPKYQIINRSILSVPLSDHLDECVREIKRSSEYDCDGIVVDIVDAPIRMQLLPTLDDLNPGYAFKWKIVSETFIGTVIGVEWKVTAYDYLKPVVLIEPVDIGGVTISRLSGFNAAFIYQNKIGIDAKVLFQRAGDVIPDILDVLEPAIEPLMPAEEWEWNETQVDAVALNASPRAHMLRLKNFFVGLDVDNLKDASIQKLIDAGYDDIISIIEMTVHDFTRILGKNGEKSYISLHKFLKSADLSVLMGSFPAFGRGFGKRKSKALIDGVEDWRTCGIADIIKVEGFDEKSALIFKRGQEKFIDFVDHLHLNEFLEIKQEEKKEGPLSGKCIAFTGIRSKDAEDKILELGGTVHDGVKKDTNILVAKDPKASSGKLDKARKQGIEVMSIVELLNLLEQYEKKKPCALIF